MGSRNRVTWVRTVASAVLILLAASIMSLWAVSAVAVRAVEDGTAIRGLAEQALDDPEVIEALGETLADRAIDALAERGLDPARVGLDSALRGVIDEAVASQLFRDALLAQVDSAHEQLATALTDSLREPAPLEISIDVSDYVNGLIDSIPVVGLAAPEVRLQPVTIEALPEETFADVRTSYRVMELASDWGLWAAIALVVAGLVVTGRRRWFLAKAAAATGVIAGALYLALHYGGIDRLVALAPGGSDGTLARLMLDIVTEATVPALESRLLSLAAWSLLVGLVVFLIGVITAPRRDRRDAPR